MNKKILIAFLCLLATSVASIAQSSIRQRHNGDASWNEFLDKNMVSVFESPEKAPSCPQFESSLSNNGMPGAVFLAQSTFVNPDDTETKSYRWFDTNFVITVYSVKRLETMYKRELATNNAKK